MVDPVQESGPVDYVEEPSSGEQQGRKSAPEYVSNNMSSIKDESPEFFEMLLESMAMEICKKMEQGQKRIAKARKDAERR